MFFSIRHFNILIIIMLAVFLAPLTETPTLPAYFRANLLSVITVILFFSLIWLMIKGGVGTAWKTEPSLPAACLLGWTLIAWHHAPYRKFADAELLRVMLGFVIYFIACRLPPHQAGLATRILIVYGTTMALIALGQFGEAQNAAMPLVFDHTLGLFGQFENLGSFLMLLLPFSTLLAFNAIDTERTRLTWQGLWLVLVITLLLSGVRAAWLLTLIGFGVIWVLSSLYVPSQTLIRPRTLFWKTILPLALALSTVIVLTQAGGMIFHRSVTLTHIRSLGAFTDRVFRTRQAYEIAIKKPLTGWGLGTWTVLQRRWTGEGDDAETVIDRHDVWSRGGDDQDTAFDYWAQWFAETGAPGLLLLSACPLSFLALALRELPQIKHLRRKAVLTACIASVIGFIGDAFFSPAYNLPGDYILPWLFMGIGVAICRGNRSISDSSSPADTLRSARTPGRP